MAAIDQSLFLEVADTGPRPNPIRLTGYVPESARDARLWRTAFSYLFTAFTEPDAPAEPLLTHQAARLLATSALQTFPNTATRVPTDGDRRDAHSATLRRAIRFIDDNAHRDISAADIAADAFVSIQALQLTFRRHLDPTPTACLRRVRLEYAHHELLAANPDTANICTIAAHWGFLSHSRFTAHCKAAFGVTPSQTLRQGRTDPR